MDRERFWSTRGHRISDLTAKGNVATSRRSLFSSVIQVNAPTPAVSPALPTDLKNAGQAQLGRCHAVPRGVRLHSRLVVMRNRMLRKCGAYVAGDCSVAQQTTCNRAGMRSRGSGMNRISGTLRISQGCAPSRSAFDFVSSNVLRSNSDPCVSGIIPIRSPHNYPLNCCDAGKRSKLTRKRRCSTQVAPANCTKSQVL
jgi:hypothetical protein